jgi:hypothetical protein
MKCDECYFYEDDRLCWTLASVRYQKVVMGMDACDLFEETRPDPPVTVPVVLRTENTTEVIGTLMINSQRIVSLMYISGAAVTFVCLESAGNVKLKELRVVVSKDKGGKNDEGTD